MPNTKKLLLVLTAIIYLIAAFASVMAYRSVFSADTYSSLIQGIDVLGVSDRLASKSSFPLVAKMYFSFCVFLYPVMFAWFMLAFWAPTLPSYAIRIRGFARVQHFLGGVFLVALGVLLPSVFHGQDSRLFPIGTSLPGLILLGWIPWVGGALMLALGLSAIFRSLRR